MMNISLRPYQDRGLTEVRQLAMRGRYKTLIVAPTGAGKTTVAAALLTGALSHGSRCLFVAHRRELIKQAFVRLVRAGLAPDGIGVMLGNTKQGSSEALLPLDASDESVWLAHGRRRPRAMMQVASIDTLRNRIRDIVPAVSLEAARNAEHYDVIIIDEAHRALANSYQRLRQVYPHAIFLGLTATPYRADGKGLGAMYDDLVVISSPRELIAEGFLIEHRVFTVPASDLPNLSRVKMKGGDYDPTQLSAAVDQAGLVGNIVEHWKRLAADKLTLAFCVSVEHSKHLAARFVESGVAAEHLDGETPTEQRDAILARLRSGETRVVCNVGVLTEGFDQPSIKCVILARPTKSCGLYLQMVGRASRPWGGQEAIVLDHAGCALEHGLPHDDREFSLEDAPKKKPKDKNVAPTKVCQMCFAVNASAARECQVCGEPFKVEAMSLEEEDGDLVEVRAVSHEEMVLAYQKLLDEANRTGKKPGWAYYRFRDQFKRNPPKEAVPRQEIRADAPESERRAYFEEQRQVQREKGYRVEWVGRRYQARFGQPVPWQWEREGIVKAFSSTPAEEPAPKVATLTFTDSANRTRITL